MKLLYVLILLFFACVPRAKEHSKDDTMTHERYNVTIRKQELDDNGTLAIMIFIPKCDDGKVKDDTWIHVPSVILGGVVFAALSVVVAAAAFFLSLWQQCRKGECFMSLKLCLLLLCYNESHIVLRIMNKLSGLEYEAVIEIFMNL